MKKIIIIFILMTIFSSAFAKQTNNPDNFIPAHEYDTRGRDVFPQRWDVRGEKLFVFNPAAAAWAVYDADGNRVMTGGASGGKDYCPDIDTSCRTVIGMFRVERKEGADCISNTFPVETDGGAPMPYCMFFHGGYAVHGSNAVPRYNASHGCVRVFPDAARWLSENFMQIGTRVLVLPY